MDGLERTQIYLTRAERAVLERVREETGTSQSELVRRAIDGTYLGRGYLTREERLGQLEVSAGAWAGRAETGADQVERLRTGRIGRLRAPAE